MAKYGESFSLKEIRRKTSLSEDVADSFLQDATQGLSLYGKRMHLTLYYQQKKHVYVYYLLWWTTAWIGGHLFYVNRARDGFRRLLMPTYILLFLLAGSLLSIVFGKISEFLGGMLGVITLVLVFVMTLSWWLSCFVELFSAVECVNSANIIIAEAIAQRVLDVDDSKKNHPA